MIRQTVIIVSFGLLAVLLVMGNVVSAAESQQAQSKQPESSNGLTVEDLARGIRSAAQNIEREIPKIGPAVGKTVKSLGANSLGKRQDKPQPHDKK